jgi:aerobic-type carbon monoxide dehydrogenase small subunit (CoxS/CutS family)
MQQWLQFLLIGVAAKKAFTQIKKIVLDKDNNDCFYCKVGEWQPKRNLLARKSRKQRSNNTRLGSATDIVDGFREP